jgi:large subunit ribosomal protein L7/L12
MPVALQVVLGVVIAVVIALILFRRPRQEPPRSVALPGDLTARLRALVAEGRKIQAIKELRERTGMSLVDAKNRVERLPPSGPVPPPAPPAELSAAALAQAKALIAAGNPIQAVKVIRDDTGWSLQQSKETMDRLRGRDPRRR